MSGGCPSLSGPDRERTGGLTAPATSGVDTAVLYTITCDYGRMSPGPAVSVWIDIDRDPAGREDRRADLRLCESAARYAGNIFVPLAGTGSGGLAIADHRPGDPAHPVVLAATWSRNAFVTANVRIDGPIRNEAELTAHSGELTTVLNDVLDDLRP